jgi:hypothetical protein
MTVALSADSVRVNQQIRSTRAAASAYKVGIAERPLPRKEPVNHVSAEHISIRKNAGVDLPTVPVD